MPRLVEILEETMLFTACRSAGVDPLSLRVEPHDPITVPKPKPKASDAISVIMKNPIWHWVHEPGEPGVVRNLTVKNRSMHHHTFKVFEKIAFDPVVVTERGSEREWTLPIHPGFVLRKFFLPAGEGRIPNASKGLWRLKAELDASLLVVLGYQLRSGKIVPLIMKEVVALGDALMPPAGSGASPYSCTIQGKHEITAKVCVPRFIVALSVTCGKERNDGEPGGILGAARIWPQVMVMSNTRLRKISAPIQQNRPAKATHMDHGEDDGTDVMKRDISAIYVTDTNRDPRGWKGDVPGLKKMPPLPYWDNLFDYYDLHPYGRYRDKKRDVFQDPPELETGEVCFVDHRNVKESLVVQAIQRAAYPAFKGNAKMYLGKCYEEPEVFRKDPFQGEFDNVHLAPKMKSSFKFGPAMKPDEQVTIILDNIAMAPFCVHDCLHTHMRWGEFGIPAPKWNLGFDDAGNPYSQKRAPMVPRNQSVFLKLTAPHQMRYRGVAHVPLSPGLWSVFNHHGSFYAIAPWPKTGAYWGLEPGGGGKTDLAMAGIQFMATTIREEPYCRAAHGSLPAFSYAGMYWRLQFTGYQEPVPHGEKQAIIPRLKILDLEKCRYGMGAKA